jgi:hypothetical protein
MRQSFNVLCPFALGSLIRMAREGLTASGAPFWGLALGLAQGVMP